MKELIVVLSVFIFSALAKGEFNPEFLHKTGFSVKVDKIDGPDFFENEREIKRAFAVVDSKYARFPDKLPKELHFIRDYIHDYLNKRERRIRGRKYSNKKKPIIIRSAGEYGINNGEGFDFSPEGLPTKLTRLSYCFGVSPRILTAQMEKESNFVGKGISYSGAVGFLQVTSVAITEVSEQMGFENPYINDNERAVGIYQDYIDCYLTDNEEWKLPWEDTTDQGYEILSAKCSEAFTNCNKKAVRNGKSRLVRSKYSLRMDNWLTGLGYGSQDNGLIYGLVMLKFYLGHNGIDKGLVAYNGDPSKVKRPAKRYKLERKCWNSIYKKNGKVRTRYYYSCVIRSRARNMNMRPLLMSRLNNNLSNVGYTLRALNLKFENTAG